MIDRLDGKGGNAMIHHILRRKSVLTRQSAVRKYRQVIAANIDTIFIACRSMRILTFDELNDIDNCMGQHGYPGYRFDKI
jgi:hypothetical protein